MVLWSLALLPIEGIAMLWLNGFLAAAVSDLRLDSSEGSDLAGESTPLWSSPLLFGDSL